MTTEQLIAAGFTQGLHERQPVGFSYGCSVLASDLNDKSISLLKAKGYTHFEHMGDNILTSGTPVYTFTRLPDLETRLRDHVDAFFPKS